MFLTELTNLTRDLSQARNTDGDKEFYRTLLDALNLISGNVVELQRGRVHKEVRAERSGRRTDELQDVRRDVRVLTAAKEEIDQYGVRKTFDNLLRTQQVISSTKEKITPDQYGRYIMLRRELDGISECAALMGGFSRFNCPQLVMVAKSLGFAIGTIEQTFPDEGFGFLKMRDSEDWPFSADFENRAKQVLNELYNLRAYLAFTMSIVLQQQKDPSESLSWRLSCVLRQTAGSGSDEDERDLRAYVVGKHAEALTRSQEAAAEALKQQAPSMPFKKDTEEDTEEQPSQQTTAEYMREYVDAHLKDEDPEPRYTPVPEQLKGLVPEAPRLPEVNAGDIAKVLNSEKKFAATIGTYSDQSQGALETYMQVVIAVCEQHYRHECGMREKSARKTIYEKYFKVTDSEEGLVLEFKEPPRDFFALDAFVTELAQDLNASKTGFFAWVAGKQESSLLGNRLKTVQTSFNAAFRASLMARLEEMRRLTAELQKTIDACKANGEAAQQFLTHARVLLGTSTLTLKEVHERIRRLADSLDTEDEIVRLMQIKNDVQGVREKLNIALDKAVSVEELDKRIESALTKVGSETQQTQENIVQIGANLEELHKQMADLAARQKRLLAFKESTIRANQERLEELKKTNVDYERQITQLEARLGVDGIDETECGKIREKLAEIKGKLAASNEEYTKISDFLSSVREEEKIDAENPFRSMLSRIDGLQDQCDAAAESVRRQRAALEEAARLAEGLKQKVLEEAQQVGEAILVLMPVEGQLVAEGQRIELKHEDRQEQIAGINEQLRDVAEDTAEASIYIERAQGCLTAQKALLDIATDQLAELISKINDCLGRGRAHAALDALNTLKPKIAGGKEGAQAKFDRINRALTDYVNSGARQEKWEEEVKPALQQRRGNKWVTMLFEFLHIKTVDTWKAYENFERQASVETALKIIGKQLAVVMDKLGGKESDKLPAGIQMIQNILSQDGLSPQEKLEQILSVANRKSETRFRGVLSSLRRNKGGHTTPLDPKQVEITQKFLGQVQAIGKPTLANVEKYIQDHGHVLEVAAR